ncbi:MAG: hypothetical protein RLZZ326_3474, partial [Planctomycetota bacterium]
MPKRSRFFCRHFILPSASFLLGCGFVAIGSLSAEGQESVLKPTAQGVTAANDGGGLWGALDAATRGYVEAANARRLEVLADQWTEGAELSEGGGLIVGREAIVASIGGWLEA